jgi:hypothetical protein
MFIYNVMNLTYIFAKHIYNSSTIVIQGGGMDMFDSNSKKSKTKKKVMGLTSALEMAYVDPTRYDVVVDAASQLCTLLKDEEVSLTMGEKLRVVKSVARAKVRAFMGGGADDYKAFKSLDSISTDLVQLL